MPPSRRKAIGMPKAKKSKVSFGETDEVIEYDEAEATVEVEPSPALEDEPGDEPEPEPEASAEWASGKKRGRPAHTPLQKAENAMEAAEIAYFDEQRAWVQQLVDYNFRTCPGIAWEPASVLARLEQSMDKRSGKFAAQQVAWEDSRHAYVEARVGAAIDLAVKHVSAHFIAEVAMLRDRVWRLEELLDEAENRFESMKYLVLEWRDELECDVRQSAIERLRLNGVL